MHEYTNLLSSVSLVQQLQNTIDEMTKVIEKKDSELKNFQTMHQREKKKYIDVSNLTDVSFCYKKFWVTPSIQFQIVPSEIKSQNPHKILAIFYEENCRGIPYKFLIFCRF